MVSGTRGLDRQYSHRGILEVLPKAVWIISACVSRSVVLSERETQAGTMDYGWSSNHSYFADRSFRVRGRPPGRGTARSGRRRVIRHLPSRAMAARVVAPGRAGRSASLRSLRWRGSRGYFARGPAGANLPPGRLLRRGAIFPGGGGRLG